MSAADNLGPQWKQGKLFLTPTEVATEFHPIDTKRYGHPNDTAMWAAKLAESKKEGYGHGAGVYSALEKNLISDPIRTSAPASEEWASDNPEYSSTRENLNEGHHRVAAGLELERLGHEIYLPVLHDDYRPEYARGYK